MQTEKIKVNQKLRCVNDISASVKTFNKVKNRDKLQNNRLKMKIPKNETQYPYNYEKHREFSLGQKAQMVKAKQRNLSTKGKCQMCI